MAESAPTTLVQNVQDDIADFQKLLFLKAMAQYVPRDYHTAVTLMPQRKLPNDEYKNWRRYLDKLSYICDFDSGGRTVTGLLAQTTAQHTIFRLATNCSHDPTRVRMLEHLTFVLRELEDSNKTSDEHAAEICRRSITLSRDKIKDYSCRLGREMKRLKTERSLVATSSGNQAFTI